MMWEGIDKRKFPRVNYKCLIKVAENGHDEAFAAYTQNIGAGGICVLLDKSVELFKSAVLEITLPDSRDPVKCKGTVVWVIRRRDYRHSDQSEYDTGIEFTNISSEDRNRIATLVGDILTA